MMNDIWSASSFLRCWNSLFQVSEKQFSVEWIIDAIDTFFVHLIGENHRAFD
jgi:hypothetical protein